ncbi:MAG: alanine racemase [Lachnospiraceae bacterium]|nr:alanine racemase [Lachnospiraceae bacterium]
MKQYDRVCAYVDLDAIRHNLESMRKNLKADTKIMGVIKTDGYGHGAVAIARETEPLEFMSGYAVATPEEAFQLRKAGIKKSILILGYAFPYSYKSMVEQDISFTVFKEDMAEEIDRIAALVGKKAKVHIKVDTAMSRIGIRPDEEGLNFVKKVLAMDNLEPEGIYTHFAKADEEALSEAYEQLGRYKEFLKRVSKVEKETGRKILLKHCANSAAIINMKEAQMDVVRAGIALYGLRPSEFVPVAKVHLEPALTLKSHIVYVKTIEKGTQVSYGGTFTAERSMRIATIPVGYGDGYPRSLSGKGYVLVHGKKARILGRICMDQFMVDVTDILEAAEGDEVTLIGKDGENQLTMEYLGELSGRFNYELACDLGKRIPRVYMKNGRAIASKDYYEDWEPVSVQ